MIPQTIIVLGRSGSGKGTQIELVKQKLGQPCLHISTGALFRALAQMESYTGKKIKEVIGSGGLPEGWIAEFLWQKEVVEKVKGDEHIIFDGTPRRLDEAEELDVVLKWLNREDIKIILIDVPEEEALERLLKRVRADDSESGIRNRLSWYNKEVQPVVDYYEAAGRLIKVDGVGTVEEVFSRVAGALNI